VVIVMGLDGMAHAAAGRTEASPRSIAGQVAGMAVEPNIREALKLAWIEPRLILIGGEELCPCTVGDNNPGAYGLMHLIFP
jgi:hypothetical protein